MRGTPANAMKARRKRSAVRVFRVESAQPYGWIVYVDGFPRTHLVVGRSLELMYAREWAKANAPSSVVGRVPYLHRHAELIDSRVPEGEFAAQVRRPVVGVVRYAIAAFLGWFVHRFLGILIFVAMIGYHAWTSQGVKKKGRG